MTVNPERMVIHSAPAINAVVCALVLATENVRILNVTKFRRAAKKVQTRWRIKIISTIPEIENKSLDVGSRRGIQSLIDVIMR